MNVKADARLQHNPETMQPIEDTQKVHSDILRKLLDQMKEDAKLSIKLRPPRDKKQNIRDDGPDHPDLIGYSFSIPPPLENPVPRTANPQNQ